MDTEGARSFILAKLRKELPPGRAYHCFEHTLDVYASAISIAEAEGVQGEGLALLKVAALFHDSGFTEQDLDHEEGSCRIARASLPGFGFTDRQIAQVCDMIMATRIPQRPRNKLARVLCDADLDYLGRTDFEQIGNTLFAEMRTYGVLSTEREWNELQQRFLERHAYFTATSKRLREPMKQEHLQRVRAWLEAHKR
jgi:predicted metal-dependent HD superfamily phosphohydrolase